MKIIIDIESDKLELLPEEMKANVVHSAIERVEKDIRKSQQNGMCLTELNFWFDLDRIDLQEYDWDRYRVKATIG